MKIEKKQNKTKLYRKYRLEKTMSENKKEMKMDTVNMIDMVDKWDLINT